MKACVPIRRLPNSHGIPLPAYASAGAAGMDFHAAVAATVVIPPGGRALIPTGFAIAVPSGFELQMRPRSGLAWRQGIILPNSPGTIDADYRGEIQVPLMNLGDAAFAVERGMRIAQGVLARVVQAEWDETATLDATERGESGFGSTGA